MRGHWARLTVMAITVVGALALTAPAAVADRSRVPDNSTSVGPLKVRVYSQMCDGLGGQKLHTRLNVKNVSSKPQTVRVWDPYAKVVYDPPGAIEPGRGTLVHLTSPRQTPAHTVTVHAEGASAPVSVAKSPCPPHTIPTTKPTTATTKPHTTVTSGPHTSVTTGYVPPVVPPDPPGGPPVGGPGVVGAVGSVASSPSSGAVQAASGTLPFTGSDMRAFAILGNLMVLIGFVMLLISHRSVRARSFLAKLTPKRLSLGRTA
jgi:hypothetical protein